MAGAWARREGDERSEGAHERGEKGRWGPRVLIAFYRARREAELARIGGVVAVNGILNGVITRVKKGEEMRSSKGW
jgi:hypothetical protein